jgi:hypothetical protein
MAQAHLTLTDKGAEPFLSRYIDVNISLSNGLVWFGLVWFGLVWFGLM